MEKSLVGQPYIFFFFLQAGGKCVGQYDQLLVPRKNVIIALNVGRSYEWNVNETSVTKLTTQKAS